MGPGPISLPYQVTARLAGEEPWGAASPWPADMSTSRHQAAHNKGQAAHGGAHRSSQS